MNFLKSRAIIVLVAGIPILFGCKKNVEDQSSGKSVLSSNSHVLAGTGIGGYDMMSVHDKAFAFDYTHSGKEDYLVMYRPGSKAVWIQQHNANGTFTPVIASSNGLGGFNFDDVHDLMFAYDFDHIGRKDYLVVYRPTKKAFWILKNLNNGTFTPVFQSSAGIGGFNIDQPQDRIFAYDYEHSGKMDYLVAYRSGVGVIYIIKHAATSTFTTVYSTNTGIATDPLNDPRGMDLGMSFDFNHTGKQDFLTFNHLNPSNNNYDLITGISNTGGSFSTVMNLTPFAASSAFTPDLYAYWIGFDFDHTGLSDYLIQIIPRVIPTGPGAFGYFNLYRHTPTLLQNVISSQGVGGYDLANQYDAMFSYDYEHSGKKDYLVLYRPGAGPFWILKNTNGVFSDVY